MYSPVVGVARLPRILPIRFVACALLVALPAAACAQLPAQLTSVAGGSGGTTFSRDCGAGHATGSVVSGLSVNYGTILNDVFVECKHWDAATRKFSGQVSFAGELGAIRTQEENIGLSCSASTQPGSGIRGRSGVLVNAIGLVCDEP